MNPTPRSHSLEPAARGPSTIGRRVAAARTGRSALSRTLLWLLGPVCLLAAPSLASVWVDEVDEVDGVDDPAFVLRPGDQIVAWSPESGGEVTEIWSPLDLRVVEHEHAPRGVVLHVLRQRQAQPETEEMVPIAMPKNGWGLRYRPALSGELLERFESGRRELAEEGRPGPAVIWTALASDLELLGRPVDAAWLYRRLAKSEQTKKHWEAAVDGFSRAAVAAAGADPRIRALLARDRGGLEFARSRPEPSIPHFENALAILELDSHDHRLQRADLFHQLGTSHLFLSRYDEARKHLETARDLAREVDPEGPRIAATHNNLGIVFGQRSELRLAEENFEKATELKRAQGIGGAALATSMMNVGILRRKRGDLRGAERLYIDCLKLVADPEPDGPQAVGVYRNLLHNLGVLAETRADFENAESYYRRAADFGVERELDPLGVGASLGGLARTQLARDNPQAARGSVRRAIAIHLERTPESLGLAEKRVLLARIELADGGLDRAGAELAKARTILEKAAPEGRSMADAWFELGRLASARGEPAEAHAHHTMALDIRRAISPDALDTSRSLAALGDLLRRQGRLEDALEHSLEAIRIVEASRGLLGGSQQTRSRYSASSSELFADAALLLVDLERPVEAFELLERSRAQTLREMLFERDLAFDRDLPEELDNRRRRLAARYDGALERLAFASDRADPALRNKVSSELEEIRREQQLVEVEVREASPRLSSIQYPKAPTLAEVQQRLGEGDALISFALGRDRSLAFVLASGAELEGYVIDASRGDLAARVRAVRRLLSRPGRLTQGRLERELGELSNLLLGPAASQIDRSRRLILVPEGPLNVLPMAALRAPSGNGASRYLVEDRPISTVPAAALLAPEARRRDPVDGNLVAFAASPAAQGPAAETRPSGLALHAGEELPPLPYATEEVEHLATLFGAKARVFTGSEATESRARSVDPSARYLHFAAHATVDPALPLESGLRLASESGVSEGDSMHNGFLQAWEIFESLRLEADLVTLSACDTALGEVLAGEGVLGLVRAFQYAGARSVLASLWQVADRSTAQLMKRFYLELSRGARQDQALRRAQLELLTGANPGSQLPHPYYWAGFQLSGDAR